MVYTEIQKRNKNRYYYRVSSVRKGDKVSKKRVYMGVNLPSKELSGKEKEADKKFKAKNEKMRKKVIERIKPKIIDILKKNKIKKAGIFGSYAKGNPKKNSDVDILIDFDGSMLDLVGLELELKEKLQKKVDLITYGGINHLLRDRILKEEVRII